MAAKITNEFIQKRLGAIEAAFNIGPKKNEDLALEEAKKKKPYSSMTVTTGDVALNIKHFNKMMGTDFGNPSTEEAKAQKAAEDAAKAATTATTGTAATTAASATETTAAASADASSAGASGAESAASGDAGSGIGEALKKDAANELTEAKREVRRYYIRPQDLFCANKADIIRALISIGNNNCSVYTLKHLGDNKDVHKLTTKDIIYYYDAGVLYDKNHVRVMDYDLYIKHEETRKKFPGDVDSVSHATFEKEYDDRITAVTGPGLNESVDDAFNQDFESVNVYGEKLTEDKSAEKNTCCICGEDFLGEGHDPAPYMPSDSGVCCDACYHKFVEPQADDEEAATDDDKLK
jgi:hypothetical protein